MPNLLTAERVTGSSHAWPRVPLIAVALLAPVLLVGGCPPGIGGDDNDSDGGDAGFPGLLAVTPGSPTVTRSVPAGTILEITWSTFNDIGAAATVNVVVEGRPSLDRTVLVSGINVPAGSQSNSFDWDTTGFAAEEYLIRLQLVQNAAVTEEVTTTGRITLDGVPTLEFTEPTIASQLEPDEFLTISYTAFDAEATATGTVELDPDMDPTSGNEIVIATVEFETGSTPPDEPAVVSIDFGGTDDAGTAIDPGLYNLLARLSDELNGEQFAEGLATIEILEAEEVEEIETGFLMPDEDVEFETDGSIGAQPPLMFELGFDETEDVLLDIRIDTDDTHNNGNEITILSQEVIDPDDEVFMFDWDGTDSTGADLGNGIYRPFILASGATGVPTPQPGPGLIFLRTTLLDSLSQQTWTRASRNWELQEPEAQPSGRRGHQMFNDDERDQIVLFGGADVAGTANAETWIWEVPEDMDTTDEEVPSGNWTQQSPMASPTARFAHAVTFDSERMVGVLFGGTDGTTANNETWEWDGTDWAQQLAGADPADVPSARDGHAIAYDGDNDLVVLFGGEDGSGLLGDTWTYDGASWTQRTPTTSPAARRGHGLAYDEDRRVVVLFGGMTASGASDETWLWDGEDWEQDTVETIPPARHDHGMVYDRARNATTIFGGFNGEVTLNDTFTYNTIDWNDRNPSVHPEGRSQLSIAFDEGDQVLVQFGGLTGQPLVGALQPANDQTIDAGSLVSIEWRDVDPTGTAQIRVFIRNLTDMSETEILSGREVTGDGVLDRFNWPVPELTPARYEVVVAVDRDGMAPDDQQSVAPGVLQVEDPDAP